MQYSVWSEGELVGETDLDFRGVGWEQCRSGHFIPTPRGLELIDELSYDTHCMRAFMHRDYRDASGQGILDPEYVDSDWFADIAEYLHHIAPYALELRDDNNAVIATSQIGIQDKASWMSPDTDTEKLFEGEDSFKDASARRPAWFPQSPADALPPERFGEIAPKTVDQKVLDELIANDALQMEGMEYDSIPFDITRPIGWGYDESQGDNELGSGWNTTLRDLPDFPRYQIHVILKETATDTMKFPLGSRTSVIDTQSVDS